MDVSFVRRYPYVVTSMWLIALLLISIAQPRQTSATDTQVVPLNEWKTFECMETAHHLFWSVNGQGIGLLDDPDIQVGEVETPREGVLRQDLTIHAIPEKNNTKITCRAAEDDTFTTILDVIDVIIKIQGLLEAPGGLNTFMAPNSASVQLVWVPPFTMDITDIEPDITHFSIYITDTDTRDVTQVNVSGTQYEFNGDKCKDATYAFAITAWNIVGEGAKGNFQGQFTLKAHEPFSLEVAEISVSLLANDIAAVAYNLQVMTTCSGRPLPESCDCQVSSFNTGEIESFTFALDGRTTRVNIDQEMVLPVNDMCDLRVMCQGSEVEEQFTTFDTQDAIAVQRPDSVPGTVDVECTFAQSSSAKGCLVIFSEENGCNLEIYRDKEGLEASRQITLPKGTYHPRAYDIEQNGMMSLEQPAVEMDPLVIEESSYITECGGFDTKTESSTGSDTTTIIPAVAIAIIFAATVITVMVVIVMLIRRKRMHKVQSTVAEIPEVAPNQYETPKHLESQSSNSPSESSNSSRDTEESQVSLEFTDNLQPPEGTPGLMYACLQVRPPRGQAVRREVDVPYSYIQQVHPNVP